MNEYYTQENWSPIKNSWISRFIFSIRNSTGLKRVAEIVSRLIGVTVISYFIGFILFIISNLFVDNSASNFHVIVGFILFIIFDIYKFSKGK